jgi:replication factor C large subunit
MAAWYDLDEAAVSYVTGSGETTNKVQSIVEDAREMRETEMEAHTGGAFEGAAPDADGGDGADTDGDANGDDAANRDDAADDVLDGNADADDRAEDAEDDDGQSGLDDFF